MFRVQERESGSYALSAYFMAKTFSSLPLRLCQSFIEMSISYWLSMINIGFDAFLGYTLCNLLVAVASESLGIICVTSLVRRDSIYAVLYTVQSIMLFMAGYYLKNFPSFIDWAKHLSVQKYAFDASQRIVFDRDIPCDGSGTLKKMCSGDNAEFISADEVFKSIQSQGTFRSNIGVLVLMMVALRCTSYLSLRVNMGNKRIRQ
mmetsp:Transcript_20430/g.29935  ORF Transcript_20430/g.29935 Transcript_20430/m.29935 type:complete len:204 (+) Transcript_20430:2-613(+)